MKRIERERREEAELRKAEQYLMEGFRVSRQRYIDEMVALGYDSPFAYPKPSFQ